MTVTTKPEQPTSFADDNWQPHRWFWNCGWLRGPGTWDTKLVLVRAGGIATESLYNASVCGYDFDPCESNSPDARPTGDELKIDSAFTHSDNQPVAPTKPMIDDKDAFQWQSVETFEEVNSYSIHWIRDLTLLRSQVILSTLIIALCQWTVCVR